MTDDTPITKVYGHGTITLTHYPSSQRVAVVQTGENAVMDAWELVEFAREAGLLEAYTAQVKAEVLREVAQGFPFSYMGVGTTWHEASKALLAEADRIEEGEVVDVG